MPSWRSISAVKKISVVFIVFLLAAIIAIARYLFIPDVAWLSKHNPSSTSFIKYREAQWRKQGHPRHVELQWVPLRKVSPYLVKAVIVSEDAKFWHHRGFDFAAMRYAAQENLEAKKVKFGASTISQQLVKNLYLRPSKNLFRKLSEAILTWRMERTLSKSRILEIYLNVIEWGDGVFGIGQASRFYFGKSAVDLSAEDAARLAVVLPNPHRMNPVSGGGYVAHRSDIILQRMHMASDSNRQGRAGSLSADEQSVVPSDKASSGRSSDSIVEDVDSSESGVDE